MAILNHMREMLSPTATLAGMGLDSTCALITDGRFLATAAPTASTVTQMAQVYKKDADYAGAINIITTLICIVTMP